MLACGSWLRAFGENISVLEVYFETFEFNTADKVLKGLRVLDANHIPDVQIKI